MGFSFKPSLSERCILLNTLKHNGWKKKRLKTEIHHLQLVYVYTSDTCNNKSCIFHLLWRLFYYFTPCFCIDSVCFDITPINKIWVFLMTNLQSANRHCYNIWLISFKEDKDLSFKEDKDFSFKEDKEFSTELSFKDPFSFKDPSSKIKLQRLKLIAILKKTTMQIEYSATVVYLQRISESTYFYQKSSHFYHNMQIEIDLCWF